MTGRRDNSHDSDDKDANGKDYAMSMIQTTRGIEADTNEEEEPEDATHDARNG
jgi:hypothetical protein